MELKDERDSGSNSTSRQLHREEIAKNIEYLQRQINS